MGETIKIYPINIFEIGAVTVTGTPDTGYPESRLYDRSVDLYWKDTASADYEFECDLSAFGDAFGYTADGFGYDGDQFGYGTDAGESIAVEIMYLAGHNFSGHQLYWEYYLGADWVQAGEIMVSGDDPVIFTLSSTITATKWRARVINITNPTASELWMGRGYSFDVLYTPSPQHGNTEYVSRFSAVGGNTFSIKKGVAKRTLEYNVSLASSEVTDLESVFTAIDEFSKPMLVKDKNGDYFFMNFRIPPGYNYYNNNETMFDLVMAEA